MRGVLILLLACGTAFTQAATATPIWPEPPLKVAVPGQPVRMVGNVDLSSTDPDKLKSAARKAGQDAKYELAAVLQHWFYLATREGQYNLACYYARSGKPHTAFYYLQEAAIQEGVDTAWAQKDPDLQTLRDDARWKQVLPFLIEAEACWARCGLLRVEVLVPQNYVQGTPIPAAIGLHGLGSNPQDFVVPAYQHWADRLNIAVICVSGTVPRGAAAFDWSEDAARDKKHLLRALESARKRVTVNMERVALFGFSQGAVAAQRLAAVFPEDFCGALCFSPGEAKTAQDWTAAKAPAHKRQRYLFVAGEKEQPDIVAFARSGQRWARDVGARSDLILCKEMAESSFPPDYRARLGDWLKNLLGL